MTTEQVAIDRELMRKATRKGLWGAFWLAVLTLLEFMFFELFDGQDYLTISLIPFVFVKGWIILDTFMHIRALWSHDH